MRECLIKANQNFAIVGPTQAISAQLCLLFTLVQFKGQRRKVEAVCIAAVDETTQ